MPETLLAVRAGEYRIMDVMDITGSVWFITCAVILGLFVFDFYAHVRVPHEPTFTESAIWSSVYIGLAVVFGGVVVWWLWGGGTFAGEYFAGYVTEKALSVDNLFVFTVIMGTFAVPRAFQQKLLLIGIVLALVMRAGFIAVGAAAISTFSWVFYLFGLFLVLTAIKLAKEAGHEKEVEEKRDSRIIALVRRLVPTTDTYDGDKFLTKVDGSRVVTPMLLALIAIGFTDVLFALDSIPAIYGLTEQPYIVFTANAFALMGAAAAVLPDRWSAGPPGVPVLRAGADPGVHRCQARAARLAREQPSVHQRRRPCHGPPRDLHRHVDRRDRGGTAGDDGCESGQDARAREHA